MIGFVVVSFMAVVVVGITWRDRRHRVEKAPEHTGASLAYAADLRALNAQTGYLSEDEREEQAWCADSTRRDLERLDATVRVMQHGLNVVFEKALRQLLEPAERDWVRLYAGMDAVIDWDAELEALRDELAVGGVR